MQQGTPVLSAPWIDGFYLEIACFSAIAGGDPERGINI
jgi:hypothetical protein